MRVPSHWLTVLFFQRDRQTGRVGAGGESRGLQLHQGSESRLSYLRCSSAVNRIACWAASMLSLLVGSVVREPMWTATSAITADSTAVERGINHVEVLLVVAVPPG